MYIHDERAVARRGAKMGIVCRWTETLPSKFSATDVREEVFGYVDNASSFRGPSEAASAFLVIEALNFHAFIANVFAG
jgi:hypothetical protein